jgi:hypothetical protein
MKRERINFKCRFSGEVVDVPVYLVWRSEGPVCFVPLPAFMRLIDHDQLECKVSDEQLVDYRELVDGQGRCVDYEGLTKVALLLGRKDGKPCALKMRVLFFAQCIMRGLLTRLVTKELEMVDRASRGRVYWRPYVEQFHREKEAYARVMPDKEVGECVRLLIRDMWARVGAQISEEEMKVLRAELVRKRGVPVISRDQTAR